MRSIFKSFVLVLVVLLMTDRATVALARGGGGGGGGGGHSGGFGGGGFHAGSFNGGGYRGGVSSGFRGYGGGGFHGYAAPSRSYSYAPARAYTPHTFNTFHAGTPSGIRPYSSTWAGRPGLGRPAASTLSDGHINGLNGRGLAGPATQQHEVAGREFADHRGFDHDHFHHFGDHFVGGLGFFPYWGDFGYNFYPWYSWYAYPSPGYAYYDYSDYGYPDYSGYYVSGSLAPDTIAGSDETPYPPESGQGIGGYAGDQPGHQYLAEAQDAFRRGEYADALRLANHAAVEMPKSAKVHEILALALFASKDYRAANMEAHAALSLGPAAGWATLYSYYGDLATYETQLDALTKYIQEHPKAADARFVLAYHDLMMGHKHAAAEVFEQVASLVPKDKIAVNAINELGGRAAESAAPPTQPSVASRNPGVIEKTR
jgi:hypothetical protein